LLGALSSTAVGGASSTTVRVGSASGADGQAVTVRLEVLGVLDPGLGAFIVDVAYDSGVVSPVSCQGDPSKALDTIVCNTGYKPGSVRVGGYHMTDGLVGDTTLADVTFRLSGDKGVCSDLTISIVELTDPSTAPLTSPRVENGSICIGDAASESTPGSTPKTTLASNLGQPAGTVAPGEAGQTPAPSPAAASSTKRGSEEGGAAAKATPGAATAKGAGNTQAGESGSGGGSSGWLIGIGVAVAAAVVAGAGAVVWKRRASPRL
jgi:hypothetical protein